MCAEMAAPILRLIHGVEERGACESDALATESMHFGKLVHCQPSRKPRFCIRRFFSRLRRRSSRLCKDVPCSCQRGKRYLSGHRPFRLRYKKLAVGLSAFQSGTNPIPLPFKDFGHLVGIVPAWNNDLQTLPNRHPKADVSASWANPYSIIKCCLMHQLLPGNSLSATV